MAVATGLVADEDFLPGDQDAGEIETTDKAKASKPQKIMDQAQIRPIR